MSSEVNGTAKFYLFIANNFQGSTENMVTAMDNNSDGYLIKAEFTKYMKAHWAGNFTESELNQFWNKFDELRDGKVEGTNLRNLNALDENELKKLEAQVEVYNKIKEYIEEKLLAYQNVVAEFGIDPDKFSNSVKESLFNKIEEHINNNFNSPNLEEELKGIVDANIETSVKMTVANLFAQNYILSATNTPELNAFGYKGDDDLQNIINRYVRSGSLDLAHIKEDIKAIVDAYLSTITNNPTILEGNLANYNWSGSGLNGLQTLYITKNMRAALSGDAGRFAGMEDDFNSIMEQFLQSKINSGMNFQSLLAALQDGSLVEEFRNSNQYKALEVLANYLDIPQRGDGAPRKNSSVEDIMTSLHVGTKAIYSPRPTRGEVDVEARLQEYQQNLAKSLNEITTLLNNTANGMTNKGLDSALVNNAKTQSQSHYDELINSSTNVDSDGMKITRPDKKGYYQIIINHDSVVDFIGAKYKALANNQTHSEPTTTAASELYNKIAEKYSLEFAEYVAEHDTDPDYGYQDIVRAVAQKVANGQLSASQAPDAIVNGLSALYNQFKVEQDDTIIQQNPDYSVDWNIDTNNVHLYSNGKSQTFDCKANIKDSNGTDISSSYNNKITYDIGSIDGNTGSTATINGDTGAITVTPGNKDGAIYLSVKVMLNGEEIQTKTITLEVKAKPKTTNIDAVQITSGVVSSYNFSETSVFNYLSFPEELKKAAIKDGWDPDLAGKAAKTLSNYYIAIIQCINNVSDGTKHGYWKLSQKVAFDIDASNSYENTVTGETVNISPTIPAIIADASHSDWSDGREDFGDTSSSTGIYVAYTKHGNQVSGIWYDQYLFVDADKIKNQFKAFLQQGLYL